MTFDVNQIAKLPVGSRSVLDFVVNLPGVNTPGGSRDSTINGLPQSTINITIDGMSAGQPPEDGRRLFARVSPRIDAVEEVTVSTAAQGAQTTGQGAVQIQFVTRSGTNRFSGSTYYYLQHYKLNSNTFFNNLNGLPKAEDIRTSPAGARAVRSSSPASPTGATVLSFSSISRNRARPRRSLGRARSFIRTRSGASSATTPATGSVRSTCSR
jgi:hypothetical protein